MKLKYIIVRDDNHTHGRDNGPERAVLFDCDLVHRDVARCHRVGSLVVVSAGFVEINGYNVRTYGESESLGKSSRPEDLLVVNKALLGDFNYRGFDEIWRHLDSINSLIDGDEKDDFGVFLVPIRNFLKSLLPEVPSPEASKDDEVDTSDAETNKWWHIKDDDGRLHGPYTSRADAEADAVRIDGIVIP